jgi:hypothetical protein
MLDAEQLRASLSRELAREVVVVSEPQAAELQIRLSDATHAQVKYTPARGERLSRQVELPPDAERSVLVLSWVSVNLVRDEASEVLDELRARRKEEEEAEAKAAAEKAAADKAAVENAAADKAAADQAAAEKAAAAEAAAEKAAADKAGAEPEDDGLLRDPWRRYDLALATPTSILPDSAKRELVLQLALGWGDSGAIRGVAVSAGALRVRQNLRGVALGLGFALVGGKARGAVGSVGYSQLERELTGVQIGAGAALQRRGILRCMQIAVGGAVADEVQGAQIGAGVAYARSLDGLATSVGAVVLRERGRGLVVAGGVGAVGDFQGGVVGAGVTIAHDLQGIAIAPVNVQRRVRGLQLGIINVADELDGAALGIISVTRKGRVQPVMWGDRDGTVHMAVKSIAGYLFTQLGGGVSLGADEFSYDAGVGAHLELGSLFFEPGVHYSAVSQVDTADGPPDAHYLHYLLQGGLRLGNKIDLLAAVGLRHHIAGGSPGGVDPDLRIGLGFF